MRSEYNDEKVLLRDELMLFRCLYQQKNCINKKQFWSGSMIRDYNQGKTIKEKRGLSNIEGHLSEFNTNIDWASKLRFPEERYLLGIGGVDHHDVSIKFTVFPRTGRPIDYIFRYDEEDNVFYGVWFFVNNKTKTSEYGGFARLEVEKYLFHKIGTDEYYYTDEKEKQAIEHSIYNLEAYYNNMEDITDMINRWVPTLLTHEEVDENTFANAKAYFKNNAKTLEKILRSDED